MDIDPPPWWLSQGLDTTWQVWSFDNYQQGQIEPDAPGFGSFIGTYLTVSPQSDWLAQYNSFNYLGLTGGSGVWQLVGDGINAYIEHYDQPVSPKHIWIQLTWHAGQQPNTPVIVVQDDSANHTGPITTPLNSIHLGNNWFHSTYEVILDHPTSLEIITISGAIFVDDLVIDTLCIPEPATISLIFIGTLLFYRK